MAGDIHLASALAAAAPAAPAPKIVPVSRSFLQRAYELASAAYETSRAATSRAVSYAGMAASMASTRMRTALEPKTLLQEIETGLRFDELIYKSETIDNILSGKIPSTADEYAQALKVQKASTAALRATYEMLARYNTISKAYKLESRTTRNVMAPGSRILPFIKCGFLEAYFIFTYLLTLKFNEDAKMDSLLSRRETGRALMRAASTVERPAVEFLHREIVRISPREVVSINAIAREFLEDVDVDSACRVPFVRILDIPEGSLPRIRADRINEARRVYSAIQEKLQSAAIVMREERRSDFAGLFNRVPAPTPVPVAGVKRVRATQSRPSRSSSSDSSGRSESAKRLRRTTSRRK